MGSDNTCFAVAFRLNFYMALKGFVWAAGVALATPVLAMADAVRFNIAPQPLPQALKLFASQAKMQVLYQYDAISNVEANAVSGELEKRVALEQLLRNTGLEAFYSSDKAATIRPVLKSGNNAGSRGWERMAHSDTSVPSPSVSAAAREGAPKGADEEKSRIEEIVVTAQKRKERSIDVPMSITAISGDELAAKGIKNMLDLSYSVPGLSVLEVGPGQQFVVIRGISGVRGTSPLVGMYLDEVPVSGFQNGFSQSPDLRVMDLERVEVLKGPQGTLFGEGAAGGVIRYITKDPDLSGVGGEIGAGFSNTSDGDWSEEVTGVINIPLVKDTFGVRVAAVYENTSGWIDQPSIGREDINDSEIAHVRVKALFAPTEDLRVKGTAEIHRNDGGGTNVVNTGLRENSNFLQAFDRSASTDYFDDYDLFNLALTYDFGFAELLSSSSYMKSESSQRTTQLLDEAPRPWVEILNASNSSREVSMFAQEFRLTSSNRGPLNWTLGANYKDGKRTTFGGSGGAAIVNLPGLPPYLSLTFPGAMPINESESWAGFFDASYKLTERLELGGGVRYFDDSRGNSDATLPAQGTLRADFQKTTHRAYLRYEVNQDVNLYASVGTGFRSGDFNSVNAINLGAPATYEPEEITSYEVGTKMSLLDGRVQLEGAVFFSEYQDMLADQLMISPVNNRPFGFTTNAQKAEVKGFEGSIAWLAADRLMLTLAGGVTDTEITEVSPTDPNPVYFLGDPVDFTPRYSLTTEAEYQFQWQQSMPGFVRLTYNRQGKSYQSDRSNGLLRVSERQFVAPGVDFLNASVGAEWGGWSVSLFGRNLLDEAGELNACVTGCAAQARPRTIGVAVGKSF